MRHDNTVNARARKIRGHNTAENILRPQRCDIATNAIALCCRLALCGASEHIDNSVKRNGSDICIRVTMGTVATVTDKCSR